MIQFDITKVNLEIEEEIQDFFDKNAPEFSSIVKQFINVHRFTYLVYAFNDKEVVAINPIIKLIFGRDNGKISPIIEDHYAYYTTVVHLNYRNQGLCNSMLKESVRLLEGIGAKKIRVAKSSLNNVKHSIFTDMLFDLVSYDETKEEFKHTYELDVEVHKGDRVYER